MCSIYEFLYSYRESYNSTFPELTGQMAINALEKMKTIKEDISSENYNPFFEFLSIDFWFLYVIGSIIILLTIYTKFGLMTNDKCHLTSILFFSGLSLNYIPILYKLIINFPGENKFSLWIRNNKYIYLLVLISIEGILNSLSYNYEFDINNIYINEGQNFQICKMNDIYGRTIFGNMVAYKFLLIIIMLIYIFIEWNLTKSIYEIRLIVIFLYIDILSLILLFLFDIIKINNFRYYFLIYSFIMITISITNYCFLYGFKLIYGFLHKTNLLVTFMNSVDKDFINNETNNSIVMTGELTMEPRCTSACLTSNSNNHINLLSTISDDNSNSKLSLSSFISRMIDYHYTT
ncbi:hypothetical protein BCR32DRAFT_251124 [Anaeromyces robustus]|uniref:G-protein coupled receptors family 3 profile domain-containing protein n=1 Tax=Anaeromyces robustus TaxID=1754192 RepID=A0A1Y1VUH2_9FUNG|nr:hypothetical protein BCR32DRAFT_251124 [Anaeromyces robustus]|eukprot:ORX64394.1 hypothetical protein BCR32DRAFT_251124 [Anaeromyces robustus]